MSTTSTWTRRALYCVAPVHAVLGVCGLLMIYPFLANYLLTGLTALVVELLEFGIGKLWRSRPDPDHRSLSWPLWVTAALSSPMNFEHLSIALGCAAGWRLMPRPLRPFAAVGLAVAAIWFSTWIWGQAFGRPQALEFAYVGLYTATALPLVVFAVERTAQLLRERRLAIPQTDPGSLSAAAKERGQPSG